MHTFPCASPSLKYQLWNHYFKKAVTLEKLPTHGALLISLLCASSSPVSSVLLPVAQKSMSVRRLKGCLNTLNASR